MKKWLIIIIIIVALGELLSRYVLGLGDTVTYVYDKNYEYIQSPNQDVRRFGNRILSNKYSMRSLPLKKHESRVLIFGDSVLNGGSLTDHNNLATSLLEKELHKCNESIRILNISAGSWGPDNAFAYLEKYGDFNAKEIILFFSSHDAHDNMNHENVVDVLPSYPSSQPCCALMDGFKRYFIPKIMSIFKSKKEEFTKINKIDSNKKFNSGWQNFIDYAKNHKINIFVVLHPTKKELKAKKYNTNGQEIISILKKNNIQYLLELKNKNIKTEYFRDAIHFNEKGQKFLFNELLPHLKNELCNK